MRVVESFDGVALWTASDGDGPVSILLSNGGAGCHDYLGPLVILLRREGRRVVRWEQRGRAIRHAYGGKRWILGGHSWGADLSLMSALDDSDSCAGLLCVAGGRLNNDRSWHAEYDMAKEREEAP